MSGCYDSDIIAYEIHMGHTTSDGLSSPFLLETRSDRRVDLLDGALDREGLTLGTYLHGLFHNRTVRRSILECAAKPKGIAPPVSRQDIDPNEEYDKLAALVRRHLDMDLVYRVVGLKR